MSRPLTPKFVSIIYFFYSRNGKLGACVVSMSFLNTLCGTDWRKHLLVTWVCGLIKSWNTLVGTSGCDCWLTPPTSFKTCRYSCRSTPYGGLWYLITLSLLLSEDNNYYNNIGTKYICLQHVYRYGCLADNSESIIICPLFRARCWFYLWGRTVRPPIVPFRVLSTTLGSLYPFFWELRDN